MKVWRSWLGFVLAVGIVGVGCSAAPTPTPAPVATANAPAAAAAPSGETEKPLFNRIRWTTASEVDNFGFDVYRAESEAGPFVRITPQPIAGGGTSDTPRSYEFVDSTIDPTKAYWYYVESISMGGERERFTPVQRVAPKRPAKESTEE